MQDNRARAKLNLNLHWHLAIAFCLAAAPVGAAQVQQVNHGALGFSMEVPADWNVIQLPNGLLATSLSDPMITLTMSPDQPGSEASLAALKEENTADATRRSQPGDVMTVEDLDHEGGTAFYFLRSSDNAAGNTQLVFEFYIDAGGKIWKFNCLVPPSENPDPAGELCRTVMQSFRAG